MTSNNHGGARLGSGPKSKGPVKAIRLSEDVVDMANRAAAEEGISIREYIELAICRSYGSRPFSDECC